MPSCLGIHIQNNLIKYAKIFKNQNSLKIEAYGVKFYDSDIEKAIEQIVRETSSYQVPISVNIDNEEYTYANIFNLLKPQDREKAIDTEFEFFCNNNNKNKNTLEYRKIKAPIIEDRDKIRVIYTYLEKVNIVEKMKLLDKYKVYNVSPIATIIPNINRTIFQDNCAVINIEQNTEVTTIINGSIYKVDKIDIGMNSILDVITRKEKSISRAYEICKNTTVYTKTSQNLKIDGNEYLDEIITILFEIIEKVKDIIDENGVEINSIYITGMGLIINNIDLLFQESFIEKKCEILVPYFVEKTNVKINIKDYIEVNSAIALAMQGLDSKNKEMNFNPKGITIDNIMKVLNSDVSIKTKHTKTNQGRRTALNDTMNTELDYTGTMLMKVTAILVVFIIAYIAITEILFKSTNTEINEAEQIIAQTTNEIEKVSEYNAVISNKTNEYQSVIDAVDEANVELSEIYASKNAIPNLLTKIMSNIPTGVQILLIENPTGKDITIVAQAEKYDQLGYFKAVLEQEGILTNITTSNAEKKNNLINITIKGELNY